MDPTTLIGLTAATLTTSAFLPQVIKCWKSKHTKDISLVMTLTLSSGIALWLIYGLLSKDLPLIYANSLSLIFVSALLALKLKYG